MASGLRFVFLLASRTGAAAYLRRRSPNRPYATRCHFRNTCCLMTTPGLWVPLESCSPLQIQKTTWKNPFPMVSLGQNVSQNIRWLELSWQSVFTRRHWVIWCVSVWVFVSCIIAVSSVLKCGWNSPKSPSHTYIPCHMFDLYFILTSLTNVWIWSATLQVPTGAELYDHFSCPWSKLLPAREQDCLYLHLWVSPGWIL